MGMGDRYIRRNEATASKRRLHFHLVDVTDGFTPELAEDGEQPEISIDGGAFAAAGIGTLVSIGYGDYSAVVDQATINVNSREIRGRYKSANTREARSLNTLIVGADLEDAIAALTNTQQLQVALGVINVMQADGTTVRFTFTNTEVDETVEIRRG